MFGFGWNVDNFTAECPFCQYSVLVRTERSHSQLGHAAGMMVERQHKNTPDHHLFFTWRRSQEVLFAFKIKQLQSMVKPCRADGTNKVLGRLPAHSKT